VGVEFVITERLIKITISDTGIGIPSDEVGNIYKPFKRASNVRFIGGFGIGLSLVSKIIEIHDADLEIRSKENEGTIIQLSFKRLR
jgi:signal transduction histidine kinase